MTCPRLIEVALPIREISAESVRDKSLRHGHLSTLHLWWARRPLSASRAVVFASLVPDPDDPACPVEFRETVVRLLREHVPTILKHYAQGRKAVRDDDPYRPYEDIPDTARNRLLTFIAKWSPTWLAFERGKQDKPPTPAEMLDDRCLVKWETSDPENEQGCAVLRIARELVLLANDGIVPVVLDPFAGGGAIPLEAARLGCQAIANDYNPVAYLILRATCEFPQRFGKQTAIEQKTVGTGVQQPLITSESNEAIPQIPNRLAHDVKHWAGLILERARARIGHLYPPGQDAYPVVGYLWARTGPCSNPTCRAEIPLLRSLLVCNKPGKRVALKMTVQDKRAIFGIAKNKVITDTEGTMIPKGRGDARCPFCQQIVPVEDLKRACLEGKFGERMVGVIIDTPQGKEYRPIEPTDLEAFQKAKQLSEAVERPREPMPVRYTQAFPICTWGFTTWGALFNPRQLLVMQTFVDCLNDAISELEQYEPDIEYRKVVAIYLGLLISRIAQRGATVNIWNIQRETLEHPFSQAKISMTWDYPEANPLSNSTGSVVSGLDWILRVIEHESPSTGMRILAADIHCGDAARLSKANDAVDVVATDPPYFDAISYADVSDYFYVWIKRGLGNILPAILATPLTPKSDEATALKHRHEGDVEKAKQHFVSKIAICFAEAKRVCKTGGVLTVMFAHQSTEAWTALINALFEADLTITATYPIDTERANRPRQIGSSVHLGCAFIVSVIPRPQL